MLLKWLLQCVKVEPLDGKKHRHRRAVSEQCKESFTTYMFLAMVFVRCSLLLLWKLPGRCRTRRSLEHWTLPGTQWLTSAFHRLCLQQSG